MGEHVLYSGQMERADRAAIEIYGIPGILLMEAAAGGIAREVLQRWSGPVVVLAGPGNNGGDGFAAARLLHAAGRKVHLLMARSPDEYGGDAGVNARIAQKLGIPRTIFPAEDGGLRDEAAAAVRGGAVMVDALLGTGVRGKLRPAYRELVQLVNAGSAPVLAVDIPTGVDPDSGQLADPAVRADATVTFAAAKPGLLLEPGCEVVGDLVVEDIGIPDRVMAQIAAEDPATRLSLVRSDDVLPTLPTRTRTGHKGSYGRVLVVGGAPGYTGAAVMAAEAALRTGAGLVTCAVPESAESAVASRLLEAMTARFSPGDPGGAVRQLEPLLARADVVALGPGLGRSPEVDQLVRTLIRWADRPNGPTLVVDADGLNALRGEVEMFSADHLRDRVVLTPHPGEMARLLDCRLSEVLADRCAAARRAARTAQAAVVLKGAPTITTSPAGEIWINSTGNPGLATGGSGDVLTGIVAALIAQGAPVTAAALSGCFLHGMAADLALETVDVRGMLPRDVIDHIPAALASLGWSGR